MIFESAAEYIALIEIEIAVINSLSAGLLPVVAYGGGPLEENPSPEF
jgi:hypothetical protein